MENNFIFIIIIQNCNKMNPNLLSDRTSQSVNTQDGKSSTLSTKALQQYQKIYLCPITLQIMIDPSDLLCGHTFERNAIEKKVIQYKKCPLCNQPAKITDLRSNLFAKQGVQIYQKQFKRKIYTKTKQLDIQKIRQQNKGFDVSSGSFVQGNKLQGFGMRHYPSGLIYQGNWENGQRSGTGTLYYTDGYIYVGEWKDNRQNGKAIVYYQDEIYFQGEYRNGKMYKGKKTKHLENGQTITYEGQFA